MCRFGSASSGPTASLQLDIGTAGPYYEQLSNITVYNRQDACQDMLQCYGLELYSEQDQFLEAHRFDGGSQRVYVVFFYQPPPPPRYATAVCTHAGGLHDVVYCSTARHFIATWAMSCAMCVMLLMLRMARWVPE